MFKKPLPRQKAGLKTIFFGGKVTAKIPNQAPVWPGAKGKAEVTAAQTCHCLRQMHDQSSFASTPTSPPACLNQPSTNQTPTMRQYADHTP
jgi:hypothetical protein